MRTVALDASMSKGLTLSEIWAWAAKLQTAAKATANFKINGGKDFNLTKFNKEKTNGKGKVSYSET